MKNWKPELFTWQKDSRCNTIKYGMLVFGTKKNTGKGWSFQARELPNPTPNNHGSELRPLQDGFHHPNGRRNHLHLHRPPPTYARIAQYPRFNALRHRPNRVSLTSARAFVPATLQVLPAHLDDAPRRSPHVAPPPSSSGGRRPEGARTEQMDGRQATGRPGRGMRRLHLKGRNRVVLQSWWCPGPDLGMD